MHGIFRRSLLDELKIQAGEEGERCGRRLALPITEGSLQDRCNYVISSSFAKSKLLKLFKNAV